VEAAVAVGQRPGRILGRHILPNVVPRLFVLATMDVGSAIIAGAGLSFLGLGAVPPTPELGAMVSDGIKVPTAWWVALFPGLVILGSVLGFNFLGDGIRDLADPRLR
jgi:peptide/nickel transport system permease protein